MTVILKICVVAVTGVLLTALLRSYKPELAIPAVLCTSIILLYYVLESLRYGFLYIEALYGKLSYGKEYFPIILKVLAIAYAAEFTSALCADAGETAIASKIQLAGKISIFLAAIPVFSSLLRLLESLTALV